ncbi:hypothetical protein RhiirC2_856817, partial [Rhizophagus irregularis]
MLIVINNAAITDIENGITLAFQYLKQNNPQGGIIINTDGFNHCNTSGVYFWCYSSATNAKAGVRHYFTKSMSQVSELHNITINAACPRTEMTAGTIGVPDQILNYKDLKNFSHYAQYRASYERPPFTTPGAYRAPRPGYGIPLGGISLMAAPDSEVEKFIGGVTDDWMEKILKTVINYLIFWDGDFNEHYIIKLDSYEPWSFKRRRKYLEIAFEFILVLKALMRYEHLQTCGTLKSWKQVKDQFRNPKGFGFAEYADADSVLHVLRVLGGEGSGDDKKDKGVSCSSCFGG